MKLGIRIWIFLPVLLLLICFPIGTVGVFTLTSNWYMQHSAGKQVNAMSVYIQEEAETLFGTELLPVSLDPKTARNHAKELVSNIREYIRTAPTTTQIAIFNSHHAQTSASASNINATSEIPAEYWAALLAEDQLSPQQTTFLSYETVNYAVQLYIVPTVHNIKAKYFIIYEEIPDAAPLLTQTKEMIFLITILLSCVFAGVFWIITGNIVKPINE